MKIKEHLKQCFTSPFGNVLAITNLVLFAIGDISLFRFDGYRELLFDLNSPAVLISRVLMDPRISDLIVPPLIYLQWVFIGWLARVIARKIQPAIS